MKSHVSTLIELAVAQISDAAAKCNTLQPDKRDIETLMSRVKHEGISFLTITLPAFGGDFERCLANGQVDPTFFRSFKKNGAIPVFLQGMLSLVFDPGNGGLLDEPNLAAIEGIKQICCSLKKLELPCTDVRVHKAILQFEQVEHDLKQNLDRVDILKFNRISSLLWSYVFNHHLSFSVMDTIPKHGPGATAEGVSGNQKFRMQRWHERLEPYFPIFWNAYSENALNSLDFQSVSLISEDEEQPVKVTPVPKTLKTPRIIAIEPVCMQFAQQAISKKLVKLLESHPITSGQINFTDQKVNRDLAIEASSTGELATIDLSAASDRVPLSLAISMFRCVPDLRDAILACRSRRAQINTGSIKKTIYLRKFASMGSALCFPVEAMYFFTLCVKALIEKRGLPLTYQSISKVAGDVYVYGDDIIVPTADVDAVIGSLQKYYCKVNVSKSFTRGKFRESCGMDAYDGEEVRSTYIRQMPPDDRRSSSSLISWVETSNQFYKRGYWLTSSLLIKRVESILGELPIVGEDCEGLGKVSFQPAVSINRWGKRYQRAEVSTWVAGPVYRTDKLGGYPALSKCLLEMEGRGETPLERAVKSITKKFDPKDRALAKDLPGRLDRTPRFGAVTLKRRYVQPY